MIADLESEQHVVDLDDKSGRRVRLLRESENCWQILAMEGELVDQSPGTLAAANSHPSTDPLGRPVVAVFSFRSDRPEDWANRRFDSLRQAVAFATDEVAKIDARGRRKT